MNEAAFATFLGALGHRVVHSASGAWYDASRVVLLGVPSHSLRTPQADELAGLLRRWPVLGLRYAAPLEARGKLSYQIVCDDQTYGLEKLSGNTRSKVRRGLRRCEIGPLEPQRAAVEGLPAHRDTVGRQGRPGVLSGDRWGAFWNAAGRTPGMEIWGAWTDDKLAAFLVSMSFGDCVEFMLARSRSDCLGRYPNNALLYAVTEEMLVRRGVREITFGLESLEPVAPLDEFKFSMGFRTKPLRQAVVFHPWLAALLRPQPIRSAVRRWGDARSAAGRPGVFWRKAAGLVRFAEEAGL